MLNYEVNASEQFFFIHFKKHDSVGKQIILGNTIALNAVYVNKIY
jgi:hypothetical protein